MIERKMRQILERRERKAKRKQEKKEQAANPTATPSPVFTSAGKPKQEAPITVGSNVRIKGLNTVGKVESLSGKNAVVIFGDMKTKMKLEQLELTGKQKEAPKAETPHAALVVQTSKVTRSTIEDRKHNFHQDIDVRGMRGDEAVDAVMHFIDDAILVGMSRVRILHGTGTGVLRQLIRQYLNTVPNVKSAKDEHVQFGGSGITVVDID